MSINFSVNSKHEITIPKQYLMLQFQMIKIRPQKSPTSFVLAIEHSIFEFVLHFDILNLIYTKRFESINKIDLHIYISFQAASIWLKSSSSVKCFRTMALVGHFALQTAVPFAENRIHPGFFAFGCIDKFYGIIRTGRNTGPT